MEPLIYYIVYVSHPKQAIFNSKYISADKL